MQTQPIPIYTKKPVGKPHGPQTRGPKPEEILKEMCDIFEESIEEVKGPTKPTQLVKIRQLYNYVASQITDATQDQISAEINRDRTTVIHSCKLVKHWKKTKEDTFMKDWWKYTRMSKIWLKYGKHR